MLARAKGVVEQALAALSNLCLDVEARLVVVKEGCLAQLREVIMKHKYHPGLQQACCDLIANLAASPENQASLVTEGCMEFILEAQRNFSGDPGIQFGPHPVRVMFRFRVRYRAHS